MGPLMINVMPRYKEANMIKIILKESSWRYYPDKQLGKEGGFGAVFEGINEDGSQVAIKRLKQEVAHYAHREINIAEKFIEEDFSQILPFLDSGFDENSGYYYLVMPKADYDLREKLINDGLFTESDAINVLLQIAKGLSEVPDIIHRDLKPENILFHNGKWKIGDFGIAKFVEETTSIQTLKGCLSPPYASPEQWRLERVNNASDIYSLGIIAYELLNNSLPFPGPKQGDYREQHLYQKAPNIDGISTRLSSIISMMLLKPPQARLNIDRIILLLEDLSSSTKSSELSSPGLQSLSKASASEAARLAQEEAKKAKIKTEKESRENLAKAGLSILYSQFQRFSDKVRINAPIAEINQRGSHYLELPFDSPNYINPDLQKAHIIDIKLGSAFLSAELLNILVPFSKSSFSKSGWDVILGGYISVRQKEPTEYAWSSNLWYADLGDGSGYRWWEVCYMTHPLSRNHPKFMPFSVTDLDDADLASSSGMNTFQLANEPIIIDGEHEDIFMDRWSRLLSKAYEGQLKLPSTMPFSWDKVL